MKNKFCRVFCLTILLAACTTPVEPETVDETSLTTQLIENGIPFEQFLADGAELSPGPVDAVLADLSENPVEGLHPDQITATYTIGDVGFAWVTVPNTWTALISVREWEEQGNTAWSGLLVKQVSGPWEIFFEVPEEDFNPVGFFLTEETLVLDLADDSGAGSGEGQLIRYIYPFKGVSDELLYQWVKEKCDEYYVPENYSPEIASCIE